MGCTHALPVGRPAVDAVELEGVHALSRSDLEDRLATASSPRLLGLWSGVVFDYEAFDRWVFARDLERVERFYRARGFYDAHARAGRVETPRAGHVRVTIVVEEGTPVTVGDVRIVRRCAEGEAESRLECTVGGAGLVPIDLDVPFEAAVAARQAATSALRTGHAFEEAKFASAEKDVARVLHDAGFAWAEVHADARVDVGTHRATVALVTKLGPRATFGEVTLVERDPDTHAERPLTVLPEAPLRTAIDLRPGQPYSTAALEDAERALLDLGVCSSVDLRQDLAHPESGRVPIRAELVPTKLRTVRLGGGTELDVIRTDVHVQASWEDRNLLGGLRKLSASIKPGLVLYPTKLPDLARPERALPEQKSRLELRQPGFLEARTSGVVRGEFNIYPVLLQTRTDATAPILGYRELRGTVGVDRTLGPAWLGAYYGVQASYPFTYAGELDASLMRVVVSYLELQTHLDLRDDRLHPHRGVYLGNDLQLAGGPLGGDAGDVRVQPEVRAYAPISRRVTFAVRGTVGFLFPRDYGGTLGDAVPAGRDVQLVYFRAFFSGGPNSNRGYPLRGVGPHGAVPFYNPGLQAQQIAAQCEPGSATFDAVRCAVPLGGLSLWETSAEVRHPLAGKLSGAAFCDASDVSTALALLRIDRPHVSCGYGLRYDTPVGPARFDVGWRVPGLQALASAPERNEGDAGTIFGAPIAVAIGIGEAF